MDPKVYRETERQLGSLCEFVRMVREEPDRLDSSPKSIQNGLSTLFQNQGYLEGNLLKGWGLIREELQTVVEHYTRCFGMEIEFLSPFSVPFEGKHICLRLNRGQESYFLPFYLLFLESLLSSYSIQPLELKGLDKLEKGEDERYTYQVQEKREAAFGDFSKETGSEWGEEFHHKMNNYLGGVTSFASLLSKGSLEQQGVDRVEEFREAILEAVRSIQEYIKKTIPK